MIQAVRNNVTWRAIPLAGLAGGLVFLLMVVVLSPIILGVDSVVMLYYFASIVMGTDVLLEQNVGILAVGLLVHFVFSIVFALIIAVVVHRWGLAVGVIGGAILGLSIYGINLYTMTVWFPWFYAVNSVILLAAHVLYGAVVGAVYEMFDHFDVSKEAATNA